jgi:hypothetical protein
VVAFLKKLELIACPEALAEISQDSLDMRSPASKFLYNETCLGIAENTSYSSLSFQSTDFKFWVSSESSL